jgi:hypothetical protein
MCSTSRRDKRSSTGTRWKSTINQMQRGLGGRAARKKGIQPNHPIPCLSRLFACVHTRLATLLSNGRKARKASFLLAINRESNGSVGDRTRSARARVLLPFPPWLARRPCMHASLMRAGPCRCRERTPHGTRHRERARGHQPPRPPGLVAASNSRAGRRRHRAIMTRRDASACTYRYSAPSALAFSRSLTQKYSQVAGKL